MNRQDAEKLYSELGGEFELAARLAVEPGPAPVKGTPIKQVRIEFIRQIVKLAFVEGLLIGFERGSK